MAVLGPRESWGDLGVPAPLVPMPPMAPVANAGRLGHGSEKEGVANLWKSARAWSGSDPPATLPILRGRSGKAAICPVRACWMAVKEANANGRQDKDQVFAFRNRKGKIEAISTRSIERFLKDGASDLGIDATRYSCHSLRIGGATAMFAAGCTDGSIKLFGRWSSDCYQRYT